MADVSVKMGVSGIGQFKQGMSQAAANIKSVDAALKLNEKQLKVTGDAETYMQQKTMLLNTKLNAQKSAVANADAALRTMKNSGVDPLSAAYQNMQARMLDAQTAMLETQEAIQGIGQTSNEAVKSTDALTQSVQGINRKISLEAVQNGIKNISDAMSAAAKKAVEMGNAIKESIMEAAGWADDAATAAQMYGLPLEKYLQMQALVETGMDTSVEAIVGAQQKIKKAVGKESKEAMDTLRQLGLVTVETIDTAAGKVTRETALFRDPDTLFWKAGKAIMGMKDSFEQEAAAQALFGKSWRELIPLFSEFGSQEEFNKALESMNINSEESVEKLAALNGALSALEYDFNVLKAEVLASLAPALKSAAEAISEMLKSLTAYLQTDEGKEKLQAMGDALKGIVENLTDIDPESVVNTFASVIDGITSSFQWIEEHWSAVKTGLLALVGAFAALKIATLGINIAGIISGLKTAVNPTTTTPAPTTGTTPTNTTPVVTKAPLRGNPASNSAAIAAAEAGAFGGGGLSAGGVGTGLAGGGTLGVGALLGGAAVIAGGTIAIAEVVKGLNNAAEEARQVETDVHRFDDFLTGQAIKTASELSNAYTGQAKDKRLIIQETVRGLMKTSGGDARNVGSPRYMLNWLAANMNTNLLGTFDYTNTSGESRNKLIDMLNMDDQNAAVAAMMLKQAGYRPNGDSRLTTEQQTLFSNALGRYEEMENNGSLGYTEGLGTILDFFNHSGMFNENGEWTIPGLEEDLAAQQAAADAMTGAAEVMAGLPQQVADAVSNVQLQVNVPMGVPNANGIHYVPFDGYMAMLHKGERVMTARENAASRSYSSNLYVESMYMNNGTDADGLAAAMAARQRSTMRGYGN